MEAREITEQYVSYNIPSYVYLCCKYNITPKTALLALFKSRYYENILQDNFRWGTYYTKFDFLKKLEPERELTDFDKEEIRKMFYACHQLIREGKLTLEEVIEYIESGRIKILNNSARLTQVGQIKFDILTSLHKDVSDYYTDSGNKSKHAIN